MLGVVNSGNLIGKYKGANIAALALKVDKKNKNIEINKSFELLFFKNTNIPIEQFLNEFLKEIEKKKQIQSYGCCYGIDKFIENGIEYFLFTQSKNCTMQSFLWLKHDLLNVLNPIMGFSDVLLESGTIEPDELELITKIHQNSRKMYNQIDKLATLQNINSNNDHIQAEEYKIIDFINEMADILWVNNLIAYPSKININLDANVTSNISNLNLRNVLENQIVFLLSFQDKKTADFNIFIKDEKVKIRIDFGKSQLPTNYLDEMLGIEKFSTNCQELNTLQTTGLNYLLLLQLVQAMNGILHIHNKKNAYYLELSFPIQNSFDEELSEGLTNYNKPETIKDNIVNTSSISDKLFEKLKNICHNFDGLIILDEWEELALKVEKANKDDKNNDIEMIVENIRMAVRLFDIDKLKKIHSDCKAVFK